MIKDNRRETITQELMSMLLSNGFTLEYVVKKKPKGIKVIIEMTQEEMDDLLLKDS